MLKRSLVSLGIISGLVSSQLVAKEVLCYEMAPNAYEQVSIDRKCNVKTKIKKTLLTLDYKGGGYVDGYIHYENPDPDISLEEGIRFAGSGNHSNTCKSKVEVLHIYVPIRKFMKEEKRCNGMGQDTDKYQLHSTFSPYTRKLEKIGFTRTLPDKFRK